VFSISPPFQENKRKRKKQFSVEWRKKNEKNWKETNQRKNKFHFFTQNILNKIQSQHKM
jgi:hypothetical protein